ncbi:4Fe-4S dicluster domain-containing protein [Sulfurospirillum barnesii]|uniref:Ferredoxin n=1 Tax=Sulfurospirillum barnesii (strain ATCC 700032 / DSM 10660 / SES-3) TaxID=760154 RepID=I3XWZ0_SULBS|nr:4Fe-4S dicluster domain-containing protein [Sulfurospirillum barnesii]AFL68464.1 ferredoxin [Sulfurospirillum barnesii SES-3]
MGLMSAPEHTPVWVNIARCKACDICVSMCPAGVLAMVPAPSSTQGSMIEVVVPDACIGCRDCELHCPDFAIFVADKSEFKFAKLSEASKERAEAIKNNHFQKLGA